jgi:hypothetical protein
MPLVTVVNPTDAQVAGPGGPYPAFSAKGVNINGPQTLSLAQAGLLVTKTGLTPKDTARAGFCLLAAATPGISTPQQRENFRLKAGQQEYQDLLRLLRSVD